MITVVHFASSLLSHESLELYFYGGWHAKFARELAKRERGIRFQCWVPAEINKPIEVERDGITYRAFPARRGSPASYIRILGALKDIQQHGEVILHIHDFRSPTTLYLLLLLPPGIPVFLQDHGFLTHNSIFTPFEAVLFRRPHRIYVINKFAVSYLLRLGIDPARVRLKAMGVDFDLFKPIDRTTARRRLDLPLDIPLVLYVSQFVEWKGLRVIADAVEKLKARRKIGIVAAGGSKEDELYEFARRKCDRVFLRAQTPTELMPLIYSAADVTCQFYLHSEVGLGVNLMESLACGTPVVSNTLIHFPNQSEVNLVGRLVKTEEQFTSNLARALTIDYDSQTCRSTALKYFSWDSIAEETIKSYKAILPKSEGWPPQTKRHETSGKGVLK